MQRLLPFIAAGLCAGFSPLSAQLFNDPVPNGNADVLRISGSARPGLNISLRFQAAPGDGVVVLSGLSESQLPLAPFGTLQLGNLVNLGLVLVADASGQAGLTLPTTPSLPVGAFIGFQGLVVPSAGTATLTNRGRAFVLARDLQGMWTPDSVLPAPRGAHAAVRLGEQIHVLGGALTWGGSGTVGEHRVFDPSNGTWSVAPDMPDANGWGVEAVVVRDEIIALGGWPNGATRARAYDSTTDQWRDLASIPAPYIYGHAVAAVQDRVFVISDFGGVRVFEYDLANDSWTPRADIPTGAVGLGAAVLRNSIYVVGVDRTLQIYDPVTDTWSRGPDLPVAAFAPAVEVYNDRLYVFGGGATSSAAGGNSDVVQVYDPNTMTWSSLPTLLSPRYWPAAVAFGDEVYVIGGFDSANNAIDVNDRLR